MLTALATACGKMGILTLNNAHYFLRRAYTLEHTMRYSMIPVNHRESVASHSFFVVLGVRLLHEEYHFDLLSALTMAISHDMGEIGVSDVNHVVKEKYPFVKEAIKKAEIEESKSFPACIQADLMCYDVCKGTPTPEAQFVHLADAMQVLQYAENEMKLGNSGYMKSVYDKTQIRLRELSAPLQKYRRTHVNGRPKTDT